MSKNVIETNKLFSNETKNSNILGVDIKHYTECGFCKEKKETLQVDWKIYSSWLFLLKKMKNKEWGGILTVKDNIITEFKIPEQEVTSTECKFKEELGGNGLIHSHHDMGAFHSSQDDNHARNLYDYSIVISNQGLVATKRKVLPCGGFSYIDVEIQIINSPSDLDLKKIKEKVYLQPEWDLNEYNFPFGNNFNKDTKQCIGCLKEDDTGEIKTFEIDGESVSLCKDCKDTYWKDETFTCDSCMENFPLENYNEYIGRAVCDKCLESLGY